MSAAKHTPGPWRVSEGNSFNTATYVMFGDEGRDLEICEVFDDSEVMALDALANARLIAAAPELLEALKTARETIRVWHGPVAWDIYDRASPEMMAINAAIAKAEGR